MSIEEMVRQAVREGVAEALAKFAPVAEKASDELLSIRAAAKLANVSSTTIHKWIGEGLLGKYGSARVVRVRRDEVLSLRHHEKRKETPEEITARIMSKGRK